jgi:hypothetical protein
MFSFKCEYKLRCIKGKGNVLKLKQLRKDYLTLFYTWHCMWWSH